MHARCRNSNNNDYKNYGGRGIGICNGWNSASSYLIDIPVLIGPQPSPRHTIDRIDNNGNYEPGNVRWASRRVQNSNRRNNRAVVGVRKRINKWQAHIQTDGKRTYLGTFSTERQAEREYQKAARELEQLEQLVDDHFDELEAGIIMIDQLVDRVL